jgi:hypothetical protein
MSVASIDTFAKLFTATAISSLFFLVTLFIILITSNFKIIVRDLIFSCIVFFLVMVGVLHTLGWFQTFLGTSLVGVLAIVIILPIVVASKKIPSFKAWLNQYLLIPNPDYRKK